MSAQEQSSEQPLKVAFQTLGCRSNYADSVDIQALVLEAGGIPCAFNAEADVYVLNTCTVTDEADKEAYRIIRRLKSRVPQARIVLTGCLAAIAQDSLAEGSLVDAVVAPGEHSKVLQAILGKDLPRDAAAANELVALSRPNKHKRELAAGAISLKHPMSEEHAGPGRQMGQLQTRARYHLRVQEGCESFCTFCIIPRSRGRISSRPVADVLEDMKRLSGLGYREVVLTGTHLGGYGQDIGSSLYELMNTLLSQDDITRLRLSSIDPNDLSDDIVNLIAESSHFCSYLHVCLQSLSDSVLKRMNRGYTLAQAERLVHYAAEKIPGCCIGSDIIAGFPGETTEQVEAAQLVFSKLPIAYLHVFPYSEREGTPAVKLDDRVELEERKRRAQQWRVLGEQHRREFLSSLVGQQVEVVVEQVRGSWFFGTTREYAQVKCDISALGINLETSQEATLRRIGETMPLRVVSYDEGDNKLLCAL